MIFQEKMYALTLTFLKIFSHFLLALRELLSFTSWYTFTLKYMMILKGKAPRNISRNQLVTAEYVGLVRSGVKSYAYVPAYIIQKH